MEQATTDGERVIALRRDIKVLLCTRIREAIQMVLEEELDEALGCGRYERGGSRHLLRARFIEHLGHDAGRQWSTRIAAPADSQGDLLHPDRRMLQNQIPSHPATLRVQPGYA